MVKVIVEGNFVGEASNMSEADRIAHQMAYRLGYCGGNVKVKYIDERGQIVGSATLYING